MDASAAQVVGHVIIGLGNGGAENSLYKLCLSDSINRHFVISLTGSGHYRERLESAGVVVRLLSLKRSNALRTIRALRRLLKEQRPDVIHAWMPHAILFASLAAAGLRGVTVVWSIRATDYGRGLATIPTRVITIFLAHLSQRVPKKIIFVAEQAKQSHIKLGFSQEKSIVIWNGYAEAQERQVRGRGTKTNDFRISPENRYVPVVGMVGRYHKQKDHRAFLAALRWLKDRDKRVLALLMGPGMDRNNAELTGKIQDMGLSRWIKLCGEAEDPTAFYRMLDLHVSSSAFGEGFSNVVAESMLLGVPNVVTDVGDSRLIVGPSGWVVPPDHPEQLAAAIEEALNLTPAELRKIGVAARTRILTTFSLSRFVEAHQHEYRS